MRKSNAVSYVLLLVLPVLVGLAVSALLLVDYLRPAPVFCDMGGGCDRIRQTAYSSVLGVPLPAFGMLGFLTLGVLTWLRGPGARRIELGLAAISALVAAVLLLIQVKLATFCPYCTVVDACALLVFAGALLRVRREADPPEGRGPVLGGAAALSLAAVVPLAIGYSRPAPVAPVASAGLPDVISAEMQKTPAGKVTVVDFVDFECPFCRMTHQELSPMLDEHASRIRVVRKQVPLPMHPHAIHAARAACCGEQLGKGDAMADALFRVPAEDLTPEGCEKLALSLSLDLPAFRSCVQNPETDARIQKETAEFRATHARGLPTIFIGDQKIEGAQGREKLEQAMSRALSTKS
ncbi:vitamin K epoxide reductase family protein [Pendulispora albinea]|uniref:Thioredoxin domain-containing protein n=1 Tax=Pendulispora albinea TaxID=2741071 RepID=A0ABZ2LSE0_9BACT